MSVLYKKLCILGVALSCLLLAACASQDLSSTPPQANIANEPYKIGIGDVLDVRVWKEPELSNTVTVRPDGIITLPLAGDIVAAGNSSQQLTQTITDKLGKFVKSPQVNVIVSDPQSAQYQQRVRVTGAVMRPTSTAWRDGMTVLDLVLLSGGLSDFASANRAILYRKSGDSVTAHPVRLDDILNKGKLDTNYPLAPSDIISVPERVL
jgi:polysaccharide biosynthesis/export protein